MTYKPEEQLTLRLKKNSELDRVMRHLMDVNDPVSVDEVNEVGGYSRSSWLLHLLSKNTDNVHVSVTKTDDGYTTAMRYVDIAPAQPVSVSAEVVNFPNTVAPVSAPSVDNLETVVRWPSPPPFIESMEDKFRKPSWYDTMRVMTDCGRHIALSGPPGVGKDTCVQELAAREGRILVTIGGDGGFRRRDLIGNMQIAAGHSFLDVAEYAAAVVNGWWVLLTEVNAADADALLFINAQLAAPYIITIAGKAYPVHPDFRLFVTYNPGLTGTKPLPQSFKDRFFSIKIPFFNIAELKRVLVAHGAYDDDSTNKIAQFGVDVWRLHERGQVRYQITSRRLMDASVLVQNGIDVKEALSLAVVGSIDSPVESDVVSRLLAAL
jgi:nitric oxide reductase NorQ protein